MVRPENRARAAFAAVAVIACAAAAFSADQLHLGSAAAAGFVGVVALGYAACALAVARHLERSARARAAGLRELEDRLGLTLTEAEARELLVRHVERLIPTADTILFAAGDGDTRLTPVHDPRIATTPLAGLTRHRPVAEDCLAVRTGSRHQHRTDATPEPSADHCALCGALPGEVLCEPLRSAGRTLGTVLVSDERIGPEEHTAVRGAARAAAAAIAGHRRVAARETRAGSDSLTELPNRRAAESELRRLCAQAGRTVSPLSAVVLELDEPGLAGERVGDAALVLVARTLARTIRASDYLARYGAQTFLVLTPDTDRPGSAELAEKLRRELEELAAPGVGSLAASLGVAALPTDALDPSGLMRQAGRALASAKARGGNCVREAEPTTAP